MQKRFIELKNGARIRIIKKENGFQISLKDQKGNILIKSDLCTEREAKRIIEIIVPKDNIENQIESDY